MISFVLRLVLNDFRSSNFFTKVFGRMCSSSFWSSFDSPLSVWAVSMSTRFAIFWRSLWGLQKAMLGHFSRSSFFCVCLNHIRVFPNYLLLQLLISERQDCCSWYRWIQMSFCSKQCCKSSLGTSSSPSLHMTIGWASSVPLGDTTHHTSPRSRQT